MAFGHLALAVPNGKRSFCRRRFWRTNERTEEDNWYSKGLIRLQVMALMGAGVARGWVESGSLQGGLNTVSLSVFRYEPGRGKNCHIS